MPPVSDGSGRDRAMLQKASELLAAAGCKRSGTGLLAPDGSPFTVEFLDDDGGVRAAYECLYRRAEAARHRGDLPRPRSGAVQRAAEALRLRHGRLALLLPLYPDEGIKQFFGSESADAGGLVQPLRRCRSGHRRAAREGRASRTTGTPSSPRRARSTACSAPRISGCRNGTGRSTGSPIGTCSPGRRRWRNTIPACSTPGGSTPPRRRRSARRADARMAAYILRRILLMIPTILGIMFISFVVVQFAPGGPVEQVIAQAAGHRRLGDRAHQRRRQRFRRPAEHRAKAPAATPRSARNIAARRACRRNSSRSSKSSSASTSRPGSASS